MHIKTAFSIVFVLVFSTAIGCSDQPAATETTTEEVGTEVASHAANTGGPQMVTSAVVETMNSGGYTYVMVENEGEEIWAAAGEFEVAVGDRVTFPLETPMQDFHSSTLDRDFPLIYFASFIAPEGQVPAMGGQPAAGMPMGHPSVARNTAGEQMTVDSSAIEKSADAISVADVWGKRADLAGSTVIVSGQVVKYNAAILGRNWFHIQDGSGAPADGTNDLTVTSAAEVAVGDVVIVAGTVVVDKDFGSGYSYTVMLEDAKVTRQ